MCALKSKQCILYSVPGPLSQSQPSSFVLSGPSGCSDHGKVDDGGGQAQSPGSNYPRAVIQHRPHGRQLSTSSIPLLQTKESQQPTSMSNALPLPSQQPPTPPSLNSPSTSSDDDWCSVVVGGSLIPPTNFGIVEEGLYRSGMPNELNFPFLERLQLKTIIYLASDDVSEKLTDFIDDQSIDLIQLVPDDDDTLTPWKPMSEDVVLSCMAVLLDPCMYPIHVMCSLGRHRTGTIIGCLRKLQHWSLSSIFEEYHRHADAKGRLPNEQFIELFDTDLVNIPSTNRPTWLR